MRLKMTMGRHIAANELPLPLPTARKKGRAGCNLRQSNNPQPTLCTLT